MADNKDVAGGNSARSRSVSLSAPALKEARSETVRIITKDLIRDLRQVLNVFFNVNKVNIALS